MTDMFQPASPGGSHPPSLFAPEYSYLFPLLHDRIIRKDIRCITLAGPPGSGKSTFCAAFGTWLTNTGVPTLCLSLDNYYRSRGERAAMARKTHPLFEHRGVPGTHDWEKLVEHATALRTGDIRGIRLPEFDKSRDDLTPASTWREPQFIPRVLLLEGWCLGARPQSQNELIKPVNELERQHDAARVWRNSVNQELARYCTDLSALADEYWYVDIADWQQVINWRWQQEKQLENPRLRTRNQVRDFLQTFERIAKHMQQSQNHWADVRFGLKPNHQLEWNDEELGA